MTETKVEQLCRKYRILINDKDNDTNKGRYFEHANRKIFTETCETLNVLINLSNVEIKSYLLALYLLQNLLPLLSTENQHVQLHKMDLLDSLFVCLACDNKHVSYCASSVIKQLILEQDLQLTMCKKLSTVMQQQSKPIHLTNCFNILTYAFSAAVTWKSSGPLCTSKADVVSYWKCLIPMWPIIVSSQLNQQYCISGQISLYALLGLWKKLVSYTLDFHNKEQKLSTETCQEILLLQANKLMEKIHLLPCICFSKTIRILTKCVPYTNCQPQHKILKTISAEILERSDIFLRTIPQTTSIYDSCASPLNVSVVQDDIFHKYCFCFNSLHSGMKNNGSDLRLLRHVTMLILKVCAYFSQVKDINLTLEPLQKLDVYVQTNLGKSTTLSEVGKHWLFKLFSDQDGKLITCLNHYLYIWTNRKRSSHHDKDKNTIPNPHDLFHNLLYLVEKDYTVLLDFLTSPETEFLTYLTLYLHCILDDWDHFCWSCANSTSLLHDDYQHNDKVSPVEQVERADSTKNNLYLSETPEHNVQPTEQLTHPKSKVMLVNYSESESSESEDMEKNNTPELKHRQNIALNSSNDMSNTVSDHSGSSSSPGDIGCQKTESLDGPDIAIISHDSEDFKRNKATVKNLDEIMTTLIQLRFSVDRLVGKKLFPYNATPLVQLLIKCEELYENS